MHPLRGRRMCGIVWRRLLAGRNTSVGPPSGLLDPKRSYFVSLLRMVEAYTSSASGQCHDYVLSFPPKEDHPVTKEP